jgi:hypothetical protein
VSGAPTGPVTLRAPRSLPLRDGRHPPNSMGETMLVHTVYFWLKPELTDAQRADFRRGVSLRAIPAVETIYVGAPAKTEKRPIIDDSYSIALTVVCKDVAAHDAYQVDPIHKVFVDSFKTFWRRVQIYDAE